MFTITHAPTWRGVQWTAEELEIWTELRWSCDPGNTLTPGSHPPLTGLFPDAAGGILCEALNIMLEVVFLDGKCSLKVRKINISTKEMQTRELSQRKNQWPSSCRPQRMYWRGGGFCLFVSCFVLGWPEAGCDAKLENPNFKGFFVVVVEKLITFD